MNKRLILAPALLIAACGTGEPPAEPESSQPAQGRAETQAIRGTSIPGHDSNAIADQVDATLKNADERKQRVEEEANEPEPE
jgi:hypothetical protein